MHEMGFLGFAWALVAAPLLSPASAAEPMSGPLAFVISGGSPVANLCSFPGTVDNMGDVLATGAPPWSQKTFINDGPGGTEKTNLKCDANGMEIYDSKGHAELTRPAYRHPPDQPATLEAIREQVKAAVKPPNHPNPIVFYVHNHGNAKPEPEIYLWGGQRLTLTEFRSIVAEIPESIPVVTVADACFGGGIVGGLLRKKDGTFRKNTCGFAPASPDEFAYEGGLYANTANLFAHNKYSGLSEAIGQQPGEHGFTFGQVHRYLKRTYVTSATPYSSGDAFLEQYAQERIAEAEMEARSAKLLSHCLFTKKGQADAVASLDASLRDTLAKLLGTQMTRLQEELKTYYNAAGLNASSSYGDLKKVIVDKRKAEEAAEKAYNGATDALRPAKMAWVRKVMGPKDFDCLLKLKAEVTGDAASGPAGACGGLSPNPEARKAEFVRLNNQRDREWLAANRNPEFAQFCKTQSPQPPYAWKADAQEQFTKTNEVYSKVVHDIAPIRRLESTIKSVNALEHMIQHGNSKELQNYLNILQCEETPLGNMPS